jgi:hypothetical protein
VDSSFPVWLLGQVAMHRRRVLKDDLQLDHCFDLVGNRLPNHSVARDPDDSAAEHAHLEDPAGSARDRHLTEPAGWTHPS